MGLVADKVEAEIAWQRQAVPKEALYLILNLQRHFHSQATVHKYKTHFLHRHVFTYLSTILQNVRSVSLLLTF